MASTPALSVWVWQVNQLCHSCQLIWYLRPDSSCQDLQDCLHIGLDVYRTALAALDNMANTPAGCNQLCHSYQLFWYLRPMASTPALSVWVWQVTTVGCNQLCHSYQLFWYLQPDSSSQDLQDWLHIGLAV